VGNKHRFIYGHQYHLRCLVQSHDPSLRWHVVRIDLFCPSSSIIKLTSRLVFAQVEVGVVGQRFHHWNPTLPNRRSLFFFFYMINDDLVKIYEQLKLRKKVTAYLL
jgi:hypothetical protein